MVVKYSPLRWNLSLSYVLLFVEIVLWLSIMTDSNVYLYQPKYLRQWASSPLTFEYFFLIAPLIFPNPLLLSCYCCQTMYTFFHRSASWSSSRHTSIFFFSIFFHISTYHQHFKAGSRHAWSRISSDILGYFVQIFFLNQSTCNFLWVLEVARS